MSFDTLAPTYRLLEAALAGQTLHRCRTTFLNETVGCRRALVLGEGPGRFLVELLRSNPRIEITCIDQSAGMVHQATKRVRQNGFSTAQISFRQMDVRDWLPGPQVYDLIVSHFFLDCFQLEEIQLLTTKVRGCTRDGTRWLLSDFCVPERGWQRARAQAIHALMYAFFRSITGISARRLTPPDSCLADAGFHLANRRTYNFGLLHSDLWIRRGA